MVDRHEVTAMVTAAFGQAALDGCLCALDIDGTAEISYRSDDVCESASTGKVPILVTLMRAVAAGELSLDERVVIPADGRTPGPSGLSAMSYPAELALRDVAQLMISISDNHATDVVLSRVSPQRVTAAMRELGLMTTTLEETVGQMYRRFTSDSSLADLDLKPEAAPWRTTAAEMCRLLKTIWLDKAASAALCQEMRAILGSCFTSNGLDSQFPLAVQAQSSGKTGTAFYVDDRGDSDEAGDHTVEHAESGGHQRDGEADFQRALARATGTKLVVRNEVGVLEYPQGGRYAVAVFTRTKSSEPKLHDLKASHAIGAAARIAVDHLRVAAMNS